ncbi:MAG: hypothetical protein ACE5J2_05965 [Nitrososphaerales archaeon]
MRLRYSSYLTIATIGLVATMVLPLSYAQLSDEFSNGLIKITAKSWKTITVVKVENSRDNIYDVKLVWLTLQNGLIRSYKAQSGWNAETAGNPDTIQFRTDNNPTIPGESTRFGIKSDQTSPIFKWIVLDEDGDELGSGILDVSRTIQSQEESPSSSNTTEETAKNEESQRPTPSIKPAIAIIPDTVRAGLVVRLAGEGFMPDSKITVLFDGKPITKLDTASDGTIRNRILIPKDVVSGAHQISVSDASGRAANISVAVKQVDRVAPLTVMTQQATYKQGELVQIIGTGKAGAAVQLTVINPAGIEIFSSAVPVDKDGKFSAFIPLSEDLTTGDYEVAVLQEGKTVKATFKVLTISGFELSVTTDKFEYKQGESVNISGEAPPNKDVNVKVLAPDGSEVFVNTVKVDDSGNYEVSMVVSGTSVLGKYAAVVRVGDEEIAITFAVVRGSVALTIQTDRQEYKDGELVRISGMGKANDKVSITIEMPGKTSIKMTTNSKENGSYSALWLVPATAKNGQYHLIAQQGETIAEAIFVVFS